VTAIEDEIGPVGAAAPRPWWDLRPGATEEGRRAERQAFRLAIRLALAVSSVLRRGLDNVTSPDPLELEALEEVEQVIGSVARIPRHPKLEYNLGCYLAATNDLTQAKPIFLTLRAVYPNIAETVLRDPDLADVPDVLGLFESPGAPLAAAASPPTLDDDPDRDEPT
jgi:hypothetical protein